MSGNPVEAGRYRSGFVVDVWGCGMGGSLSVILIVIVFSVNSIVPVNADQSPVRIENNQLIVEKRLDGGGLDDPRVYTIKMVNWSPCDVGDTSGNRFMDHYATDIPLMRAMNANTVRTFDVWDDGTGDYLSTAVLDNLYDNGIMVNLTAVWDDRINSETYIKNVVRRYRDHPAVLLWSLGNEWNLWSSQGMLYHDAFADPGALDQAKAATEQAAQWIKEAYTEVGLIPVPVVSSLVYYWDEDPNMGWEPFSYYADIVTSCPSVDAYGINMYQEPAKYVLLFQQWAAAGFDQPLFLGEYGADAWNSLSMEEDQEYQAFFDALIWRTTTDDLSARDSSNAVLGLGVFAFNDEWWKMGNASGHETTGGTDYDLVDGYRSEEWMGVTDVARVPRASWEALRKRYPLRTFLDMGGPVTLEVLSSTNPADPALTCYTRFHVDDQKYWKAITEKYAPAARGMNILVLDLETLAIRDARNFDLYEEPWLNQPEEDAMREFLSTDVPNGSIVMMGVSDTATYWDPAFDWLEPATVSQIQAMGSQRIDELEFRMPWAFITVKDDGGSYTVVAEVLGAIESEITASGDVIITDRYELNCDIDETVTSPDAPRSAAAAIETLLRYTGQRTGIEIPDQETLYVMAGAGNQAVNQGENFVDPDGLAACLNSYLDPWYEYQVYAVENASEAMAILARGLALEADSTGPVFCPAIAPVHGDTSGDCYREWILVRGVHVDTDPVADPFQIESFRIRDYVGGLGSDAGIEAANFAGTWLTALDTPNSGDRYQGKHVVLTLGPATVTSGISCVPTIGTVPFSCSFTVSLTSQDDKRPASRVAARIDVQLAGGASVNGWRTGYTNLQPKATFSSSWQQTIPALGSVIGENTFTLRIQDVTPSPYNQPPYPPSGDTDWSGCSVVGVYGD